MSTSRALCLHCDLTFELAPDAGDEARCPRCMRKGVPVAAEEAPRPVRRGPVVAGLLAAAALFGGGYYAWRMTTPAVVSDTVPDRPLERRELAGHLVRVFGHADQFASAWVAGDAVQGVFGAALAGKEGASAVAAAVQVLAAAHRSGKLTLSDARGFASSPPRTPEDLAAAIARGETVDATSIELTLLAVVALREAGVPARVAEVVAYEGSGAPADPAGRLGAYVVALPDPRGTTFGDVSAAPGRQPVARTVRVLDDLAALAPLELARAARLAARTGDGHDAMQAVDRALRLDPRSPSARTLRAILLLGLGDRETARREADAAAGLRRDAPRLALLASFALDEGDAPRARALAEEALVAAPDHGGSHAILSAVALARGDLEAARASLARVQATEPTYERIDALTALVSAASGDEAATAAALDRMITRRADDPRARFEAGVVAAQVGDRDRALRALGDAIRLSPEGPTRRAMRDRIGQLFGPSVIAALIEAGVPGLDMPDLGVPSVPEDVPPDAPAAPLGAADGGVVVPRLQLGGPQLGGPGRGRPSLLGGPR